MATLLHHWSRLRLVRSLPLHCCLPAAHFDSGSDALEPSAADLVHLRSQAGRHSQLKTTMSLLTISSGAVLSLFLCSFQVAQKRSPLLNHVTLNIQMLAMFLPIFGLLETPEAAKFLLKP